MVPLEEGEQSGFLRDVERLAHHAARLKEGAVLARIEVPRHVVLADGREVVVEGVGLEAFHRGADGFEDRDTVLRRREEAQDVGAPFDPDRFLTDELIDHDGSAGGDVDFRHDRSPSQFAAPRPMGATNAASREGGISLFD